MVQNKNSKKGRWRKVIRQGKAHLQFTGKDVTAHGGRALAARGMEAFGVRKSLESFAQKFDHRSHHGTARIIEQLITLRLMGGEAMSDTGILKDTALQPGLAGLRLLTPPPFHGVWQNSPTSPNQSLQQIVSHLSSLTQGSGQKLFAIDSTVSTDTGKVWKGLRSATIHISRADPLIIPCWPWT